MLAHRIRYHCNHAMGKYKVQGVRACVCVCACVRASAWLATSVDGLYEVYYNGQTTHTNTACDTSSAVKQCN